MRLNKIPSFLNPFCLSLILPLFLTAHSGHSHEEEKINNYGYSSSSPTETISKEGVGELRASFEEALSKAILHPTLENVTAAQCLQGQGMDAAEKMAKLSKEYGYVDLVLIQKAYNRYLDLKGYTAAQKKKLRGSFFISMTAAMLKAAKTTLFLPQDYIKQQYQPVHEIFNQTEKIQKDIFDFQKTCEERLLKGLPGFQEKKSQSINGGKS